MEMILLMLIHGFVYSLDYSISRCSRIRVALQKYKFASK
jgi:hypothetical protein